MLIKRGKFASKMIVQFKPSQDTRILLLKEELDGLEAKMQSLHFFANCIRATSHEAGAHFFVGVCIDNMFNNAHEDENVQYILPEEPGDPYYINIKPEAIKILKEDKTYSIRYFGGHKFEFIIKEDLK